MTDTLTEADAELARTLRMAPEDLVAVAKTIAQSPLDDRAEATRLAGHARAAGAA